MRGLLVNCEHMLWPETNSYHPRRNSTQHRESFEKPRGHWWGRLLACIEDAFKEMLMHKDLHTLGKVGGPLAAVLNSAQVV
jgi:hypothetical protein